MATNRLVFGSDNNCVTANWKRPVAADLTPGLANQVLKTNSTGTNVIWADFDSQIQFDTDVLVNSVPTGVITTVYGSRVGHIASLFLSPIQLTMPADGYVTVFLPTSATNYRPRFFWYEQVPLNLNGTNINTTCQVDSDGTINFGSGIGGALVPIPTFTTGDDVFIPRHAFTHIPQN